MGSEEVGWECARGSSARRRACLKSKHANYCKRAGRDAYVSIGSAGYKTRGSLLATSQELEVLHLLDTRQNTILPSPKQHSRNYQRHLATLLTCLDVAANIYFPRIVFPTAGKLNYTAKAT